jgi:MGT family glycosyltransferase
MATFLFTIWPFPGHVHPNVAIAHALSVRDHEVRFYTAGSIQTALEAEGFRCFPYRSVEEAEVWRTALALDALSLQWWRARERKALLRAWLLQTIDAQLQDLTAILAMWQPDVIVCDPAMWAPLLVLQETTRIPLAIMSYAGACMLPGPDGPIPGLSLPQPQSKLARRSRGLIRSLVNLVAADIRHAANQVRARHGLPSIHTTVTAFAGEMPLYLVSSTPAFDRERRDLPGSVQYIGPCQWDKPNGAGSAPWLTDLVHDRPVVYVTEGTSHSKPPLLLRAALRGLSSLPLRVIGTTGKHRDPAELGLGAVPANARVEQWVPHSDLLPRTDVVVTTGGTGTVMGALSAGVPLVVVPTAWDQPENAWRVAESGAGIRLPARRCTPERVRDAVQRVLSDPSFRCNARRLAADFARYGGPTQAADLLEGLAVRQGKFGRDKNIGPAAAFSHCGVGSSANDVVHATMHP